MDSQSDDAFFTQLLRDPNFNNDFVSDTPTLAPGASSQPSQSTIGSSKNSRGDNFTREEDILLVNGWLNTSLDPIVGNDQKSKRFWIRVQSYYHECKKPNLQERISNFLMNRWSKLQRCVNNYCRCLAQIENLHPSGYGEADKIKMAKITYNDTYKKVFQYEHCWDILRYQPKWILHKEFVSAKKNRGANDCSSILETMNLRDEVACPTKMACERPLGKKAQKENEKKKKFKKEKTTQFEKVISDLKEERRQFHNEKMAKIDMLAKIEERKIAQKEKEKIDQIMMMDISGMDVVQQEYFKRRRLEIVVNMKIH